MKIFMACSSKNHYEDTIKDMAKTLAHQGHDLIFGAASTGMMGIASKEFAKEGRGVSSVTVEK